MSPECFSIFDVASSGVRMDESKGVSNNVSGAAADLVFSGDFLRSGARRSFKVLNSSFSNSGVTNASSGPAQVSASISKSTGAS